MTIGMMLIVVVIIVMVLILTITTTATMMRMITLRTTLIAMIISMTRLPGSSSNIEILLPLHNPFAHATA